MTRTQVQLPDELYRAAKRIAVEHEITLAEVVRRGLEHMIRIYPPKADAGDRWQLPAPRHLGRFRAPVEEWRELANEDLPAPR
jgi:hypothetical protein